MDGFIDLTFFVSTTLTYLSIKSQQDTKYTNRVRLKNEITGTSFAAFAIARYYILLYSNIVFSSQRRQNMSDRYFIHYTQM